MRVPKCLLFLPLLLQAQTGGPPPIVSVSGSGGMLATPGSSVTLTVQVNDRSGNPVQGANILFIAPPGGATGAFEDPANDGATFFRAVLDLNTVPGVFFVDAGIEDTPAVVSFAVSTVTPDTTPAFGPDDARAAVIQQFLPNTVLDETFRLLGPLILPGGTVIATADPQAATITVATQSWLFWLDPSPVADFGHPSQLVLWDASNSGATPQVVNMAFYPVLTLPGGGDGVDLLPPSRTNLTLTPAPMPAGNGNLARRGRKSPRDDETAVPAANTCAIVIYGANERHAKVDAQNMVNLFQNTLNIPNVFTNTDANGNLQPSDIANLNLLINQAVMKGCQKVYLYISAHGGVADTYTFKDSLGGSYIHGFISLTTTDSAGNPKQQDLSLDSFATLLQPFTGSQTQLCLIVDSCYSGNFIQVVQNLGINGVVVTAADRATPMKYSPVAVFNGAWFTEGLITVWQSLLPSDTNPVSLNQVMSSLYGRGSGLFIYDNPLAGNPQIATIDPNGGVFPVPDVTIPSSVPLGQPVTATINRPAGVTGTVVVTLQLVGGTVANVNGGVQATFAMKDGVNSVTVTFTGLRYGVTAYIAETQDSNNKTYSGTGQVQVGDGYVVSPSTVNLTVGQTATATVTRLPALVGAADTLTFTANQPIVSIAPVNFSANDTSEVITIVGTGDGTAAVTGTDSEGRKAQFSVGVTGQKPAACITTKTSFNTNFTVVTDTGKSAGFVGLQSGVITLVPNGNQITLTGDRNQIAPASGAFDPVNCTFTITGVSTGQIAGFNNVHVTYKNMKIPGPLYNTLTGEYDVATMGEFLGEPPVVYSVTGTLKQ